MKFINENTRRLHKKVVHFERERDDTAVEIALQYNDSYRPSIFSYANNINTIEGGTHLTGFKQALTRTINTLRREEQPVRQERRSRSRATTAARV